MNTKTVMTLCAGIFGVTGIILSFLPQEAAASLGWADAPPVVLQMLGALYFGFALMNWTAKENLIGGIYGRPIALGNFAHFVVGALTLIRWLIHTPATLVATAFTVLYAIFALVFAYILFTHPTRKSN